MKLLFLVRHAKSAWDDPTLDDHERPLNDRGKKNIPDMAHRLNAWQLGPQHILTSSALRASETGYVFSQRLHGEPKLSSESALYTESADELLHSVIHCDDAIERLMLVGHNPAVTELATLLGMEVENMPTCGIAVFGFDVDCWQAIASERATLYYYDYPKRRIMGNNNDE